MKLTGWLDRQQQQHRWLGVPLAVIYKFVDDQGVYLAGLITYYGFLSLFPLLLVLATVLGFLLPGNPDLQRQLIDSALAQFPIIGDQLTSGAQPLRGSGVGLATGIVVSLYGALGFSVALQNALNQIWGVPVHRRPNPFLARLRSLLMLGLLGVGVVLTTALATLSGIGEQFGPVLRWAAVLVSIAVNAGLFVLAFRALTARRVTVRDVLPGAVLAAVCWQGLQAVGAVYVDSQLRGSTQVYGLFGIVLGLLAWINAGALVVVLSAEVNVVLAERLWPRSLLSPFIEDVDLTRADRRSYASYAHAQRYRESEEIDVDFRTRPGREDGDAGGGDDQGTDHGDDDRDDVRDGAPDGSR
ncbi:MAG TPA: YihY/virulence factor BrkB family protein [Pseudonocardia sp.]|nr:YihY/virulence factor BrkB family protein [Pseudonocardia sp.]